MTQAYINLFPVITSASIPEVTTLRSNLSINVFLAYNYFFLIARFVNSSLEVTFQTALIFISPQYITHSSAITHFHFITVFRCENNVNVTVSVHECLIIHEYLTY